MSKSELFEKLQTLASEYHQLACDTDLGEERVELFSVYQVLHNLSRRGYAAQVCSAMNPLLHHVCDEEEDDWDEE